MAQQGFLARVAGRTKQVFALLTSAGAADAGKIPSLDASGKLDLSFMPSGIGPATVAATASEALAAGDFINFHANAGVFSMRKADNSNDRQAHGFVVSAYASAAAGVAYPLDAINSGRSGLTIGAAYWLGTAGGVTTTPPPETTSTAGTLSQYLGVAKSATELVTDDSSPVIL